MPSNTHRTLSGIDLTAPGGLEALFAYHRTRFGDAQMMSETPPEGGTGEGAPPPAPPSPPTGKPAPPAPAPPAGSDPTKVEDLPDWAQKLIRDTRKEAGDNRTAKTAAEQQRQEMLDGIAKALGLKTDETPPDPAVLQQTVTQREERISALENDLRVRDVELAAFRSASQLGADAAALLDSRSFVTTLTALDPAADDFAKQVETAIKKAVEANPKFQANPIPAPGAAGIGASGAGGTPFADMDSRETLRLAYAQSPHQP